MPSAVPLVERIRDEVRANGSISFSRFMELALYDSEGGYYSRTSPGIGRQGDYFTASDVGREFGRAIARQLIEIDRALGCPSPFMAVEFGAGRGLLARDVLDAARRLDAGFRNRLHYRMVERSAAMRALARRAAPEAECVAPGEGSEDGDGCVLAVELFDALPVDRVRRRLGRLVELRIELDRAGNLIEVEHPASPSLVATAEERGVAAHDGIEGEIASGAGEQLALMAAALRRGVLVVVDYGDTDRELHSRPRGTLLAYHGHGTNEDFLERIGEQDLTAHVDFSLLQRRAAELGLERLGLTTQDRFLIANGILEAFEPGDEEGRPEATVVKRRLQAMQLIHPEGMGRAFKVLALSKGLAPPPALSGLRDPFA